MSVTERPGAERARPVTRRGLILLAAQLAVAGGLAWRMRQLQIVETEKYRLLAEENRINLDVIAPVRGQLFDRNGVALALNRSNYRVVMVREQAGDPELILDRLDRLIHIAEHDRTRALKEIRQKDPFVRVGIADNLSWQEFARINANAPALPGIHPDVGLTRFYPHGALTAHVVGYVGRVTQKDLDTAAAEGGKIDPVLKTPDFQIGKTGIERAIEFDLRGEAGRRQIEVNAVGRVIRELDRTEGLPGSDMTLTLDLDLQRYCHERLGDESAAVVVMDTRMGDLLALASNPTYDPNPFVLGISHDAYNTLLNNDHRPLHNKWASGMYPPGSTFKMVVALAALHAGAIDGGTTHYCPGFLQLGNRRFHCWRRGGHGTVNLRKSLEQSCDVFYYEVARTIGIDRIAEMARSLGLGVEHAIPMTAMKAGLMPTKDWKRREKDEGWQLGDSLNSGIGQGFVLATPLQLAVMTARIATGAKVAPRMIRARAGAQVPPDVPEPLGIDPRHLNMVRRGMFDVVNSRRGTARGSRIEDEDFLMAGKTGTSQVRIITAAERARGVFKNEDLPWNRRDHALFVAFAPAETPRYAISVIVEHGGGGSRAAAPIAKDIMLKLREIETRYDALPSGQGSLAPGRAPT